MSLTENQDDNKRNVMIKKSRKEYYLKNREQILKYQKEYNLKNPEIKKERDKKYRLKNKEKKKEYDRKNIERTRILEKNRYKTDINFRLKKILRNRIRQGLKGINKSTATMELIGCTINELRKHLESKFEPWMNWKNYGLWDIDHIKAMSNFDLRCPVQQHACCHWSNLQPLEHIANIKKGAR